MSNKIAEDTVLITSFLLTGNTRIFDRIVLKYQSQIRRFMLNMTIGDDALSDDLAQETFIKAYLNIQDFKALSSFSTWLFRIAYNVFYDSKRAEKCTISIEALHENDFVEYNSFSCEKIDIFEALNLLKPEERIAILLFYMEDKTQKEISKITGNPIGTVKSHLLRGKEKLSKFLIAEGYGK